MSAPLAVLLIALLLPSCATARRAGDLAVADIKAVATAPLRASEEQWRKAAITAGAVGVALALDDEARALVLRNDSDLLADVTRGIEPFGGRYADRVLYALLAAGAIRDDRTMIAAGFDGVMTSLIASKGITPLLKNVTHRARPGNGSDDSFPSNHATQAFGIATVIASHYDQRWIDITAYAIASGVAYSRVDHDDHWLSDVIAGAAIGTAVGRVVVTTNKRQRWRITPTRNGVIIHVRY